MPRNDIRSNIQTRLVMNNIINTDTDTDTNNQDVSDFDGGVKFNIYIQSYTDGDYEVQIFESDDGSSFDQLTGDSLIPASTSISLSAATSIDAIVSSVGFISAKKFAKLRIVSTNTSTGATILVTMDEMPEIKPVD